MAATASGCPTSRQTSASRSQRASLATSQPAPETAASTAAPAPASWRSSRGRTSAGCGPKPGDPDPAWDRGQDEAELDLNLNLDAPDRNREVADQPVAAGLPQRVRAAGWRGREGPGKAEGAASVDTASPDRLFGVKAPDRSWRGPEANPLPKQRLFAACPPTAYRLPHCSEPVGKGGQHVKTTSNTDTAETKPAPVVPDQPVARAESTPQV